MTATRAIPQAHELAFIYNDEFDRTHYPIQDWQRKAIAQVCEALRLTCSGPTRNAKDWTYHATIHGGIFWCAIPCLRMHADDLAALVDVPGFRWIESHTEQLTIGLTHRQP